MNKTRLITRDRSFYQTLLLLAVPAALQNMITFLVTFADNLMVGRLGDIEVSGVFTGGQIMTFLQLFIGGIEGTLLVLVAQYWGKKDVGGVKTLAAVGVRTAVATGFIVNIVCALMPRQIIGLFTNEVQVISAGTEYLRIVCFSYVFFCITQTLVASMRSVENARIGLYVSLVSLVSNIFFNYILIFGKLGLPAMGIHGAALATVIARVIECSVMLVYTLKIEKRLKIGFGDFLRRDLALTKDFFRYGLPIISGQIVWSVNTLVANGIMGRFSAGVITAASVVGTLNSLAYVVLDGMSGAVSVITGKTVGAGKIQKVREYSYTVQILFAAVGVITGLSVFLVAKPFIGLYTGITEEAVGFARQLAKVLSVTIVGTCFECACLKGLVKAGGDVDFVFKNDAIFVFLIVLPSALIAMHFGAPAWLVFALLKSDQILKCFVAFVKINSFNWIHDLTRETNTSEVAGNGTA